MAGIWYAQDAYHASDRLTVNFGARVDVSRQLIDAWQISPRVGVSYRLQPGTTLRASFMRLFQPPQAEYPPPLIVAGSTRALALRR